MATRQSVPPFPPQSMKVDLPAWVVSALDNEADRRGVPRQSLVKFAVVEWLEAQGKKARAAQKKVAEGVGT